MCGEDKACGCGCEAKPSRRPARRDVVLTDREGRTFDPPRRADYDSVDDYLDAYDDYRRRISDAMSSRGMQLTTSEPRSGNERGVSLGFERDRLSSRERNRLPASAFALPHRRALPIPDASHTRNAAARLEQMRIRGTVSPAEYREAKQRILSADAHFGIEPRGRDETNASLSLRSVRDPDPLVVGGLYYLEWDAHDEGDEGTYVYNGVYPQTGAHMFRRVSRFPNQRVTIYLFPHEIRYVELIARPRAVGPHGVSSGLLTARARAIAVGRGHMLPPAPESAPRRRVAPELRPGRVLTRPARAMPRVWDEGIVGPALAREAQFQGLRRINNQLFGVWTLNGVLYAQPKPRTL